MLFFVTSEVTGFISIQYFTRGVIFVAKYLPETRGLSLEQIEDNLKRHKNRT
jgi:major inositol transporter-like SP family MFS transporter